MADFGTVRLVLWFLLFWIITVGWYYAYELVLNRSDPFVHAFGSATFTVLLIRMIVCDRCAKPAPLQTATPSTMRRPPPAPAPVYDVDADYDDGGSSAPPDAYDDRMKYQ